jgi:hypothetical protein
MCLLGSHQVASQKSGFTNSFYKENLFSIQIRVNQTWKKIFFFGLMLFCLHYTGIPRYQPKILFYF